MKDAVNMVAELMAVSARTAPKSAGQDYVDIKLAIDEERERIGKRMIELEEKEGRKNFRRDGNNVLASEALLLIGCKEAPALGLDCGACACQHKPHPTSPRGRYAPTAGTLQTGDPGATLF